MPKRALVAFGLLLIAAVVAHGKDKQRDWQTGKVLDSGTTSRYIESVGNGSANSTTYGGTTHTNANASSVPIYQVNQVYTIELGDHIYVAQERLRWRWSKAADVTVNAPVKVAIEKNKMYIMGDDGKEHEAEIVKKVLLSAKDQKEK